MLPSQNELPPELSAEETSVFQQRFSTADAIATSVRDILRNNSTKIDTVLGKVTKFRGDLPDETSSTISGNIRRIPEDLLLYMHGAVATLGLSSWNPDVMSTDPNSMYNTLHEQLAIQTFQHIVISHGYAHFGINHGKMGVSLLKQLYRNFVYGRMRDLVKRDLKSPGGVKRDTTATNVYKRRSDVCCVTIILSTLNSQISIQLAAARVQTLISHSFNPRTLALAEENDAHSDDELRPPPLPAASAAASSSASAAASSAVIYDIKQKGGRSIKVKMFFRMLDAARAQSTLRLKARHRRWAAPPYWFHIC
jgi:hypothetical protein